MKKFVFVILSIALLSSCVNEVHKTPVCNEKNSIDISDFIGEYKFQLVDFTKGPDNDLYNSEIVKVEGLGNYEMYTEGDSFPMELRVCEISSKQYLEVKMTEGIEFTEGTEEIGYSITELVKKGDGFEGRFVVSKIADLNKNKINHQVIEEENSSGVPTVLFSNNADTPNFINYFVPGTKGFILKK